MAHQLLAAIPLVTEYTPQEKKQHIFNLEFSLLKNHGKMSAILGLISNPEITYRLVCIPSTILVYFIVAVT